jgi:glutamate synthase domain-containing protein 3
MVDLEMLGAELPQHLWHHGQADDTIVKQLVENHVRHTGSKRGAEVLAKWNDYRARFVKVFPKEYRRALGELAGTKKKAA